MTRNALRTLAVANAAAFSLHLAATFLPFVFAPEYAEVGQVSDKYPTAFTPAGITFAIWGIIYLLLAGFCVFHLVHAFRGRQEHPANESLRRIGWLFALNNVATAAWLLVFVREMLGVSLVLIIVQVVSLIAIVVRLRIWNPADTVAGKAFTQTPISVYTAWLCIATIANTALYLKSIGWTGGLQETTWAVLMISVATLITLFMVLARGILPFGLVVLWALYGIVLGRQEEDAEMFAGVIRAAWIAFGVVALAVVVGLIRKSSRRVA